MRLFQQIAEEILCIMIFMFYYCLCSVWFTEPTQMNVGTNHREIEVKPSFTCNSDNSNHYHRTGCSLHSRNVTA